MRITGRTSGERGRASPSALALVRASCWRYDAAASGASSSAWTPGGRATKAVLSRSRGRRGASTNTPLPQPLSRRLLPAFRGNNQRRAAAPGRRDRAIGAGPARLPYRRGAFAIAPFARRPHQPAIDAVPACAGIRAVPWRLRFWCCPIVIALSALCYRERGGRAIPTGALHRQIAPLGGLLAGSRFPRLLTAHRQASLGRTITPRARAERPARRALTIAPLAPRYRRRAPGVVPACW